MQMMSDKNLQAVLDSNVWNFQQSEYDKMVKAKKASYRHRIRHPEEVSEDDQT